MISALKCLQTIRLCYIFGCAVSLHEHHERPTNPDTFTRGDDAFHVVALMNGGGVGVWGGKSAAMMEQGNLNVSVNMFVRLMFVQENREKGDFKKSPCLFGSLWFSSLWLNLWAFEEELLVSLLRPSFYFHRVSLSAVSHWVEFGVFCRWKNQTDFMIFAASWQKCGAFIGKNSSACRWNELC